MNRDKMRQQMQVLRDKEEKLLDKKRKGILPRKVTRPVVRERVIEIPQPLPRKPDTTVRDTKIPGERSTSRPVTVHNPSPRDYGYQPGKVGCSGCMRKRKTGSAK